MHITFISFSLIKFGITLLSANTIYYLYVIYNLLFAIFAILPLPGKIIKKCLSFNVKISYINDDMSDFTGKALIAAGRMIKAKRRQLGLSQEAAAVQAGISVGTWSLLERGIHRPKPETAKQIEDVMQWDDSRLQKICVHKEDNKEKMSEFGDKVRTRRRELKLSRQTAAFQAGISVSGWQHIERGRIRPRPHTAKRIAEVLNWDLNDFAQLHDHPVPPSTIPGLSEEQTRRLVEFGEKIRLARKRADLTQISAAKKVGLSNATWSPLERGRVRPILSTLLKICSLFNWDYREYADLVAPNSGSSMMFLETQMHNLEEKMAPGEKMSAHVTFHGVDYYTTIDDHHNSNTERASNQ
jgi:transcriptional regulator with XRE-family HTH domain